jgi:5-methylcytosine-specific restriction endonuclease McrA
MISPEYRYLIRRAISIREVVYMPLCKFCAHAGCNKIIDISRTYCSRHTITKAQRDKEYDAKYRDQKAKAFYNSKAWQMAREKALTRDNHIDIYLYMTERRIVRASIVHHIIEYKEDPTKGLEPDNLISVSEETHESTIKKMYSNDETKRQMQQALRKALNEYKALGV